MRLLEEGGRGAGGDYAAFGEDAGAAGDAQGLSDVLLDEEHGYAFPMQALDHLEHAVHDGGREAEGRLVEQQEPRKTGKSVYTRSRRAPRAARAAGT